MAHLTEGAIISEIRGSIGSRTFSKNAYGPYVKNKLNQSVRNTPLQIQRRNLFKAAVLAWQNLTNEDRLLWRSWAKENPKKNSLGKTVIPTAYNLFISSYILKNLASSGTQPWRFVKDPIPLPEKGVIYGGFNPLSWEFEYKIGNGWFHTMRFLGAQQPITSPFVNPSTLRYYDYSPAAGFSFFEVETINNLMGFPSFVQDSSLFSPVGLKMVDIRSGLSSPLYIYRLQSIANGDIF